MPFSKFIEIGRIAFIAFGHDRGKICAIVDVIDQNRALVDGPCSNVSRQPISFKRLHLTKFRIKFPHSASTRVVRNAWMKADVTKEWNETSWAKKLAAAKIKNQMTDFDRFKLYKAKQTRNRIIHREYLKLKTRIKKSPPKLKLKRHANKSAAAIARHKALKAEPPKPVEKKEVKKREKVVRKGRPEKGAKKAQKLEKKT
uniref:Large ribosomal subunit protein eL14 n=1 Tax=Scolopendra viridis TaxID=118503 RepID=A0A4D5R944_SCOVI